MGVVYRAEHTLIGRPVALKLLHPDLARNPQAVDRFFREARAANEIANPHIVEVTDFGRTDDDANFLVMEFLTGIGLSRVLEQQGALSPKRAVHIALQIAEGLSAAHQKGVIHRDLKPGNIQLIERNGDSEFVKIMDFGIAKITETNTNLTKTGMILGSPAYMSPEQASGKPVDHRTDIYAMGIILYEMLIGRPPFVGDSPTQILVAHVTQEPSPPRSLNAQVPEPLEQLVLHCLAKEASGRPETMAQVAERLKAWYDGSELLGPLAMAPTTHAPVADPTPPPTALAAAPPQTVPAPVGVETAPPVAATPVSATTPGQVVDTGIPADHGVATVGVDRTQQRGGKGLMIAVIASVVLLLTGGAVAAVLLLRDGGETDAAATKLAVASKTNDDTPKPGEPESKPAENNTDKNKGEPDETPEPEEPKDPGEAPAKDPGEPAEVKPGQVPGEITPDKTQPPPVKGPAPRKTKKKPKWKPVPQPKPEPRPEPAPAAITRRLTSVPSGAAVYQGQKLLGTTPLTIKVDKPRKLALAMRGYKPYYLTATRKPGPIRVTLRKEIPEWQRTKSFGRLKDIFRSRKISRQQYNRRKDEIKREVRYKVELIVRRWKRGEISRSERRRLVRELKQQYR
jgi:serine/threonine protein kinase